MSRLVDLAIAAHDALNACGFGAEAEAILEHDVLAVEQAERAVRLRVSTRLTGAASLRETRALEALADLAACDEPAESQRPTLPCAPPTTWDPCAAPGVS